MLYYKADNLNFFIKIIGFWGSGGEVKSLWSIYVGLHMRYKGENNRQRRCKLEQNLKNHRSSDCRLKLVCMKSESLVIVNQHVTVNDLSNFAHTAHHARRVVSARNCFGFFNAFGVLLFMYWGGCVHPGTISYLGVRKPYFSYVRSYM